MARRSPEQLYEEAERALIGEAIAETEQEIFDDALSLDPDDNDGDRSLEEMDGEEVLDDDVIEEEEEGDAEGEGEGGEADETSTPTRHQEADRQAAARQDDRRGVPPARLRETAERARTAEAERDAARAEAREVRARLENLERQAQRPQGERDQRQAQQEPPDLFADPEARLQWERTQVAQEFEQRRINASFDDAREAHGDTFVTAFQALQASQSPALVREIVGANNPGRALMSWHQRQSLMADIGNDPAAYRQKLREELLADPDFKREMIGSLRNEARGRVGRDIERGRGEVERGLVPSLNSATGGASHRASDAPRRGSQTNASIEKEIFESAFDD